MEIASLRAARRFHAMTAIGFDNAFPAD